MPVSTAIRLSPLAVADHIPPSPFGKGGAPRSVGIGSFGIVLGFATSATAQARNPFGVGISEGGGSSTGITGWLLTQQAWFEHQISAGVRAAAHDASAVWWLAALGFVYGVFHAAGPGHGKAVLASYMIANERALRRGVLLSILAALLQGLVAILLVGILAALLHATAQRMKDAASLIEMASFAGVACLGAWLVWRKGRSFARAWKLAWRSRAEPAGGSFGLPAFAPAGSARLAFAGNTAASASGRFVCVEADAAHLADCLCHAVAPSRLAAPRLSWREAAFTVLAAGARPCSGAILVLVFALVQGVFLTGVVSVLAMSAGVALATSALASLAAVFKIAARRLTRVGSPRGVLILAGLELAAAFVVLLAGTLLLLGYAAAG